MSIPLRQQLAIGSYLLKKKLTGVRRYPLVLMLEPLFQCNLACAGCGKISYAEDTLRQRMSVEDALAAVDECGAPVVSIAGGEPLIHNEMPQIIEGIIARKKFVYLCTNALLLKKKISQFKPSPYFSFSIHLDGDKEHHDASVCRPGVYDTVVEAIAEAVQRGFRVTINCTLFNNVDPDDAATFFEKVRHLGVEGITISPGYSYELAPDQDVFLPRDRSKQLFRDIFRIGKDRGYKYEFNQSSLFLDFLTGNQRYQCTPWSNPTYNLFGWQRPCYLLVTEGYAPSFKSLMEDTLWDNYGVGVNSKCNNCMAHCGFEGTAVNDAFRNPLKALWVSLRGPRITGAFVEDFPIVDPIKQVVQIQAAKPLETESGTQGAAIRVSAESGK